MGNLALDNEKVGSDIYLFLGLEESAKGVLGKRVCVCRVFHILVTLQTTTHS